MRSIAAFLNDESAQGLVEYALIISFVSVAAIAALNLISAKTANSLSNSAGMMS